MVGNKEIQNSWSVYQVGFILIASGVLISSY